MALPAWPYGCKILITARSRNFTAVRDAEKAGIAVIYQELSLVKEMTIAENIFLGREPRILGVIRREELYRRAQEILKEVHLEGDPYTPIGKLGIGQQQLVEIAKALSHDARIRARDPTPP